MTQEQKDLAIKILEAPEIYYKKKRTKEIWSTKITAVKKFGDALYVCVSSSLMFPFDSLGTEWAFDIETIIKNIKLREIKKLQKVIDDANKKIKELEKEQ